MNFTEKLKDAIEKKSWDDVCVVYEMLTGQKIKIKNGPSLDESNRHTFVNIRQLLQNAISLLPSDGTKDVPSKPVPPISTEKKDDDETIDERDLISVGTKKTHHYGGVTELVTGPIIESEIEKNKQVAQKTRQRKTTRPPKQIYKAVCSKCNKDFESDFPTTKDIGSSCPDCTQTRPGKNE